MMEVDFEIIEQLSSKIEQLIENYNRLKEENGNLKVINENLKQENSSLKIELESKTKKEQEVINTAKEKLFEIKNKIETILEN